ncbi:Uncharacterised protein [uncultured archaeon]|nr:Uncharacterised protein [uncultured archaeon]
MATKMAMKCEGGCCGVHWCNKCALPVFVFGLLFLIAGTGVWVGAPMWFNGWTILGVFMALGALMTMMMKKM